MEVRYCLVVLCLFISLCSGGCGTYVSPAGNVYDLNPLTTSVDYTGNETINPYEYVYNYCQNIQAGATQCTFATPVAQVAQSGTCTPVGALPAVLTEFMYGGIKLVYTNNYDLCGNPRTIPRVSTFILLCSANSKYTLVNITEPGVCQYDFTVQTPYACPVKSLPSA